MASESLPFSTPPHLVDPSANLAPFSIRVPDSDVQNLMTLLRLSHIASPNFENSHNDGYFGIPRDALLDLVSHWQTGYSWRKWESALNAFPQFKITITHDDDHRPYTIHFLALFSTNPSAIPILLLHGWPGSVVEFLPLLQHVRSRYGMPADLPYHLVVPHFVGYGFSSPPPLDRNFTHIDNAGLVAKLMRTLGFGGGYVVQGGDLGGATAPVVSKLDDACRLVHVNMLGIPPPEGTDVEADIRAGVYTPDEIASLARTQSFLARGTAFIELDGTRPSTAGFVIGSNPVSLLAWIGEKMMSWTDSAVFDPAASPEHRELLLTNVSLYWFSRCYPTSMYHHRIAVKGLLGDLTGGWRDVRVPMGYSWFRKEISNPPKPWIDKTGKVTWYRKHAKGGHFAALEQPEVLWQDIEDFVGDFYD